MVAGRCVCYLPVHHLATLGPSQTSGHPCWPPGKPNGPTDTNRLEILYNPITVNLRFLRCLDGVSGCLAVSGWCLSVSGRCLDLKSNEIFLITVIQSIYGLFFQCSISKKMSKNGTTKNAILQSKESSNQKIEENKSILKLNFT